MYLNRLAISTNNKKRGVKDCIEKDNFKTSIANAMNKSIQKR
jgi:hypothetical protein